MKKSHSSNLTDMMLKTHFVVKYGKCFSFGHFRCRLGLENTAKMYEPSQEVILSSGSASNFPNNLSVFDHEAKHITFACIAHKNQVVTLVSINSLFRSTLIYFQFTEALLSKILPFVIQQLQAIYFYGRIFSRVVLYK